MRTARTRVLWLVKGLGRGGAERLISLSVAGLDVDRFHVEVAYVLPWKDAFVGEIRDRGVPVHCLGKGHSTRAWVGRLHRLMNDGAYDVIHTHSPQPAVVARLAPVAGRPVLVHTEHNVWQRYRRPTAFANAATYHRNAAVLAVSAGVAASIKRPAWVPAARFPPVETLHHGLDLGSVRKGAAARHHARRELGIPDYARVIGTVGNCTPKKDQRSLLEAFRRLAASRPDTHLVHIGSGPLEGELREQARRDLPTGRVHFLGTRDDVQALLPALDVFTLSSLHEGLSIAVLEAMATEIPCVVTNVGGLPEVIADGVNGLLVPPRDVAALTTALERVLDDPDVGRRLAATGTETGKRFSIATAVRRMEDLYDDLVTEHRARSHA